MGYIRNIDLMFCVANIWTNEVVKFISKHYVKPNQKNPEKQSSKCLRAKKTKQWVKKQLNGNCSDRYAAF